MSGAPGSRMGNVWVNAGVQSIFAAMPESIKTDLGGGSLLHSRAISAAVPEGAHADALRQEATSNPQLNIDSYPFARSGRAGTTVVARGVSPEEVNSCAERIRVIFTEFGADDIEVS